MKLKNIIFIIAGLLVIAVIIFRLKSNKDVAENRVYQFDKEAPIPVHVEQVKSMVSFDPVTYTGTFEPNKEVKVSADIQGKVNHVYVDHGAEVRKGQPLIQLDNSLIQLQLQSVLVQIEGVESDISRYTVLSKADAIQGVQLEKAQLALKTALVQKATLQEQLNKTLIRAPFDGVVTAKLTEEGAFAAPGSPLIQLTQIQELRFTIQVPERDLGAFQFKQNYSVRADSYPDIELTGTVISLGSKANTGNSFSIQLQVKNREGNPIKSGMFGKLIAQSTNEQQFPVIPSSALQGTSKSPYVFLVEDKKAIKKDVVVGVRKGNQVTIQSGISVGDVIITNGFINLFDGANVLINK